MKTCSKCGIEKEVSEFYNKGRQCKLCKNEINKAYAAKNADLIRRKKREYAKKNKERIKDYKARYYQENRDSEVKKRKLYYQENKDIIIENVKEYYREHKEKVAVYNKKYQEANRAVIKEQRKLYRNSNKDILSYKFIEKYKNDVITKLKVQLRNRLNKALKNNYKTGSAVRDLGCSIEEIKAYLESKFQPGMSWENWTTSGWHIDHIVPLASFDLTNREELLKACHYTNLQPLWAADNLRKGSKVDVAENK